MIKTNTTRKPTTYIPRSHGILPGCKQGTDVRCQMQHFPAVHEYLDKTGQKVSQWIKDEK